MSFDIDDAFAFSNRTLLTIFHTCRDSPRAEVGLDSAADPSRAAARVARPLGDAGCPGPPAGPCWPGTSRAASDAASASRRLRRGLTSARAGSLGSAAVCSVTGADQKLPWVGSGGCCGGGGGGGGGVCHVQSVGSRRNHLRIVHRRLSGVLVIVCDYEYSVLVPRVD